ncbi:hypothetical protein JQC92_21510 [Shewanella sp. 202IG2-18]|uniref:hypothetical protein n=1 Tax=Parashewanella hymeniacidonis TaxID=2807618 RepID=UPI0019619CD0|nr:hypothetical protein [Parashewanella hymeniacidonis]MBM7074560.1 hypothetical protein [Parashewanella hymeniacidonis]
MQSHSHIMWSHYHLIWGLGLDPLAEIYLKPDNKEECAGKIRDIVAKFIKAEFQVILTVMEDDDNKYANIISQGNDANNVTL